MRVLFRSGTSSKLTSPPSHWPRSSGLVRRSHASSVPVGRVTLRSIRSMDATLRLRMASCTHTLTSNPLVAHGGPDAHPHRPRDDIPRSEEHTSELQSLMRISYAVFCLKKKKKTQNTAVLTSKMN